MIQTWLGLIIAFFGIVSGFLSLYKEKITKPCIIIMIALLLIGLPLAMVDSQNDYAINQKQIDNEKLKIKLLSCKDLGNYIIDNAGNRTLENNGMLTVAHDIHDVRCKA